MARKKHRHADATKEIRDALQFAHEVIDRRKDLVDGDDTNLEGDPVTEAVCADKMVRNALHTLTQLDYNLRAEE